MASRSDTASHRAEASYAVNVVLQKFALEGGTLELAMTGGEWLVMPSAVYELSNKLIALLLVRTLPVMPLSWKLDAHLSQGNGTQREPFLARGRLQPAPRAHRGPFKAHLQAP